MSQINYRSLQTARLELKQGITAIVGQNAAGKSNVLDAIYLGYTGEILARRIEDVIKHGETEAYVALEIENDDGLRKVEIGLSAGHKSIKIDGQNLRSIELGKEFAAVLIRPEDAEIVHGSPSKRRAFLDSILSRLSLRYAVLLKEYNRVVEQRNAALKNLADLSLEIWTEKFLSLGTEIMSLRQRAITKIDEIASEAYKEVAKDAKTLSLVLRSGEKPLRESHLESLEEERYRGTTVVGPHRDDILLNLDGYSVQTFGSRGEARTTALTLKVAEYRLLKEKHKMAPLLLLDDFSAEFDLNRRSYILNLLADTPQAIVTGTELAPQYDVAYQIAGGVLGGL